MTFYFSCNVIDIPVAHSLANLLHRRVTKHVACDTLSQKAPYILLLLIHSPANNEAEHDSNHTYNWWSDRQMDI